MICTSIQYKTLQEIAAILESGEVEMAEIRIDRCPTLSESDIDDLFSSYDLPLVATCRIAELMDGEGPQAFHAAAKRAERLLTCAIEAGAAYVDLEVEAPAPMGKHIRRKASECGATLIRSYHDFEGTSSLEGLLESVGKCRLFGADVVKLVTTAHSREDADRLLSLYTCEQIRYDGPDRPEWEPAGRLIAFCMGAEGRQSRFDCLALGAPYTYAALSDGEQAAPGQWATSEMMEALYGPRKPWVCGEVRMPASKSFAQRAIIAAALCEGTSHLRAYSPCADSEAAIRVARALGAEIAEGDTLTIKGIGPITEDTISYLDELCTGESGLLTRLMIPILARLRSKPTVVRGERTLLKRPLSGANDIMAAFGVVLTNEEEHAGKEVFVPLRIQGRLLPGRAEISGKGGSQLISGLLMSLPLADKPSTLYVDDPRSIPYMFITLDVLKKFGIRIANEMEGGEDFLQTQDWAFCTGMTFKVKGGQTYKAADFDIEGDWSSAAAFLAAGAIFGGVQVAGLDTRSLQADLSIMDVLVEAGAGISQIDAECVEAVSAAASEAGVSPSTGTINVAKAPLTAFSVDLNNAPDLFPVVSVLAAFCEGTSRIAGVGRLVGKESNRAEAIHEMLLQMGVGCEIKGDDMLIDGMSLSRRLASHNLIRSGSYTSRHDHRMVMALKVAALGADGPIVIDDEACVAKSYPTFLEDFS